MFKGDHKDSVQRSRVWVKDDSSKSIFNAKFEDQVEDKVH